MADRREDPRQRDELSLWKTPYSDLLGLRIAIVSVLIGLAAGGLPILLSSPPDGIVSIVTYWLFIVAFISTAAGVAWQVLVTSGVVRKLRGQK